MVGAQPARRGLRARRRRRARRTEAACELPNPTPVARLRCALRGGERTIFDANSPAAGDGRPADTGVRPARRAPARRRAADRAAPIPSCGCTSSETQAPGRARASLRLLGAQEQLAARSAASRGGRAHPRAGRRDGVQSGVASRYDQARADAELALVGACRAARARADVSEQASALAALARRACRLAAARRGHAARRCRRELVTRRPQRTLPEANPAARLARDEAGAAEARIELAQRERYPVPSLSLGPHLDRAGPSAPRISSASRARFRSSTAAARKWTGRRPKRPSARERERGANASLQAEFQSHRDTLRQRRAALARFDREVFDAPGLLPRDGGERLPARPRHAVRAARRAPHAARGGDGARRVAGRRSSSRRVELRALAGEL